MILISACDSIHFGPDCAHECHCQDGDLCNIINGVCPGLCNYEWTGASCQTRKAGAFIPMIWVA